MRPLKSGKLNTGFQRVGTSVDPEQDQGEEHVKNRYYYGSFLNFINN